MPCDSRLGYRRSVQCEFVSRTVERNAEPGKRPEDRAAVGLRHPPRRRLGIRRSNHRRLEAEEVREASNAVAGPLMDLRNREREVHMVGHVNQVRLDANLAEYRCEQYAAVDAV